MNRLLVARRIVQLSLLALLPLFPLLGWVHVDVAKANLTLFGVHLWAQEATLVVLMVALGFALLALVAAVGGRIFCGWICPQTALSEIATFVESRVRLVKGRGRIVAAGLGLALAVTMSLVGGLALLTFFVPLTAFSSLLGPPVNTSLLKGMALTTILVFVVVLFFRHLWCQWICLVGWWQRLFVGPGSLRLVFDPARSKDCTNCGACSRACFMKLEPRRRKLQPTCVNCAECEGACQREMAARGLKTLISMKLPEGERSAASGRSRHPLPGRGLGLALLLILLTGGAFTVAATGRQPVQIEVRQAERLHIVEDQSLKGAFHVDVYNNRAEPMVFELEQIGLTDKQAGFSSIRLRVEGKTRAESDLWVAAAEGDLSPGRHTVIVAAKVQKQQEWVKVAEGKVVFVVPPSRVNP